MKKSFVLFLLATLSTCQLFAQPTDNAGALKVSLSDNTPISVSLDGRFFHKHGASITVNDLPGGKHYLKIFSFSPGQNGGYENVLYEGKVRTQDGAMTIFVFDQPSGNTSLTMQDLGAPDNGYAGPGNPDGSRQYYDNQQGNGQYPPQEGGQYQQPGNNQYPQGSGQYQDQGNNQYQPQGNSQYPQGGNQYQDQQGNNQQQPQAGGYQDQPDQGQAAVPSSSLTAAKVDNLKVKADSKLTDTQKLKVIEAGLANETMSTNQVKIMMNWLTFENSKLLFAKWAYPNTVDQQNFRRLEGQFIYENSRAELDGFINSGK
jgi:hypothetical protein